MSYNGYSRERGPYGDKREKPPLYGIWEVDKFIKNQDTIPPLLTDTSRWKRLIVNYSERASIQIMNDSMTYTSFIVDASNNKIYMDSNQGVDNVFNYTVSGENNDHLLIEGTNNETTIYIELRAKDLSKMELTGRGFHWVNEYPYNR